MSLTKRSRQAKDTNSKPQPSRAAADSDSDLESSEGSDDEVSLKYTRLTLKNHKYDQYES